VPLARLKAAGKVVGASVEALFFLSACSLLLLGNQTQLLKYFGFSQSPDQEKGAQPKPCPLIDL